MQPVAQPALLECQVRYTSACVPGVVTTSSADSAASGASVTTNRPACTSIGASRTTSGPSRTSSGAAAGSVTGPRHSLNPSATTTSVNAPPAGSTKVKPPESSERAPASVSTRKTFAPATARPSLAVTCPRTVSAAAPAAADAARTPARADPSPHGAHDEDCDGDRHWHGDMRKARRRLRKGRFGKPSDQVRERLRTVFAFCGLARPTMDLHDEMADFRRSSAVLRMHRSRRVPSLSRSCHAGVKRKGAHPAGWTHPPRGV